MNKKNKYIMLGVILLLSLTIAALWGRVSSLYLSLETCSAVLFTVAYFFSAEGGGTKLDMLALSVAAVGCPAVLTTLIIREDKYFGYAGGMITSAAMVCGGIIFLFALLSRHETGPLRAALGINMLPAFFGAASLNRLIPYFNDMGSMTFNFKDKLCFDGVLFAVFAIGVFIGANRKELASANTYLALLIWSAVFGGILWAGSHWDKALVPVLFK
ncbi:MAG: hypothetical protein IKP95_06930 [Ruminococcus sp.]|nr:hypothetical protein [Ruminococcus sp.]